MSWNWLFSFPLLGYFFPNVFHCSLKTHFKVGYSKVIPSILARHDIKTEVYLSHSLKNRRKKIWGGKKKSRQLFSVTNSIERKAYVLFSLPSLQCLWSQHQNQVVPFALPLLFLPPPKIKKTRCHLDWLCNENCSDTEWQPEPRNA